MHTAAFRANALLTYAGTALAVLAALASLTGAHALRAAERRALPVLSAHRRRGARRDADLVHKEAPVLDVRLAKVERLHALESGNDEARRWHARAAHCGREPLTWRRRACRRTWRFPCRRT
jgi:hypothetical protein